VARKKDLANKLSQGQSETRPGWREAIAGPGATSEEEAPAATPPQRESPLKRKTYLLTPELIAQIAALADEERVGINELVRYLLRSALDQVEEEALEIPTRPATRKIVQ
jgi:hypothetical protein